MMKEKVFLEEIKKLVRSEQEALFCILKNEKVEYSENSNGIFFDVSKLSKESFRACIEYIDFCRKNRDDLQAREDEQRKAQDIVDSYN
jgi:hypothetical protein